MQRNPEQLDRVTSFGEGSHLGVIANVKEGIVSNKESEAVVKMKQAVLFSVTSHYSRVFHDSHWRQGERGRGVGVLPSPEHALPALRFESYVKSF